MKISIEKKELEAVVNTVNQIGNLVASIPMIGKPFTNKKVNLKDKTLKIMSAKATEDGDYEITIVPELIVDVATFVSRCSAVYMPVIISVATMAVTCGASVVSIGKELFEKWKEDPTPEQLEAKRLLDEQKAEDAALEKRLREEEETLNEDLDKKIKETKEELSERLEKECYAALNEVKDLAEQEGMNFVGEDEKCLQVVGLVALRDTIRNNQLRVCALATSTRTTSELLVYNVYKGTGRLIVETSSMPESYLKLLAVDPIDFHNSREYKKIVGYVLFNDESFDSLVELLATKVDND